MLCDFTAVDAEHFADFDGQFDKVTVSTVLGWIEVQGNGEIFLQVGEIGIIRTGKTWDAVYWFTQRRAIRMPPTISGAFCSPPIIPTARCSPVTRRSSIF